MTHLQSDQIFFIFTTILVTVRLVPVLLMIQTKAYTNSI